ncbi:7,8-dihydro-8-oxoguanine triphosphatase NUDT15 [Planoprotostelium fungivorum]|uniref:7,8-dihydro-8-oxoguanine triphosphatase NUDT15 n=1 Tax=Planoprotostelium fungivorum TaxID=1890364 RepID=A0A2P6P0P5_9EUKA|nr:7,8-dihydro-8-oxoguanine triphosphatase NUDT15 [Planoprotostelium fungivorum]
MLKVNTVLCISAITLCYVLSVSAQAASNESIPDAYYPKMFTRTGNVLGGLSRKTSYKKGDDSLIIMNIYTDQDAPNWRQVAFIPTVDKFTLLEANGTGTDITLNYDTFDNVWVSLSFGGQQFESPNRYFRKPSGVDYKQGTDMSQYFVGSFSAIIQLNRGVIDNIYWDDGCKECSDTACFDGQTCAITMTDANNCVNANTTSTCNIKVYIVWSGTDADGFNMGSISNLPSHFAAFSLKKIYLQTSGVVGTRIIEQEIMTEEQKRVRVGVGVFVTRASDNKVRFLIGKRKGSHGEGAWALPGGHLEFGEDFESCAKREVFEETGLTLPAHVSFLTATNDLMEAEGKHYVTIFMHGVVASDAEAVVKEPNKCEGWLWVTWEELFGEQQYYQPLFSPLLDLRRQHPSISLK